ncbi:IMPACT family protein [Flagellimonas nanhaiensis]|uniref:YigZ family protein n=1 Tax=Flagellimonas nanhaiensis TaxID=2292706 RepID=A0A371JU32_9FLAO|nr:YigZ family protein [Allomuricauda nanhaiensis]RDY61308.1 YigZ family protein [Allomuricauda nanhaiensis]
MKEEDVYHTIEKVSPEILFKDRKSKFYGQAFPIRSEEEVKPLIEQLRKKHHTANHVCYAWQLGEHTHSYRANDDGEPNNSAGMPIYGQIQSFGLTNILVTVTRIFGGTKLGVGGLISAYRTAAQIALDSSDIVEKTIETIFDLRFGYPEMDKVMRTIKQKGISVVAQKMEMDCAMTISIRKSEADTVFKIFDDLPNIKISRLD